MGHGYILLYRDIEDCWIWDNDEPYSKGQAWVDLLMLVNHRDAKTTFNGEIITVERGQRITSSRVLGERWGWSKDKVLRFLRLLESDNMVKIECDSSKTLLTVVNYDKFQTLRDDGETVMRQGRDRVETKQRMNNTEGLKDLNIYINSSTMSSEQTSEPSGEKSESEIFLDFPTKDGTPYLVKKEAVRQYLELYPGVDVEQEIRSMKAWCLANPTKLKTVNGMPRFITSWLNRSCNGGSRSKNTKKSNADMSRFDTFANGLGGSKNDKG